MPYKHSGLLGREAWNAGKSAVAGLLGGIGDLQSMVPGSPGYGRNRQMGGGLPTSDDVAGTIGADLNRASGIIGLLGQPDPSDVAKLASMQLALKLRGARGLLGVERNRGSIDIVENLIKEQKRLDPELADFGEPGQYKVLFHSGDSSQADMISQGLEPQMGEWVNEVLEGATDDEDLINMIRESSVPVSFLSDKPDWVRTKVARKLGKSSNDVTLDDIRNHGHLAVFKVDPTYDDVIQATDSVGHGYYDKNFTNLFGEPDTRFEEVPFGVEPGDYITESSLIPEVTLTGDDLIEFLKKNQPDQIP